MNWPWSKPAAAPAAPTEDPIVRMSRALSAAREMGAATILYHDPDLGQVRAAFYQPSGPRAQVETDPAKLARMKVAEQLGFPPGVDIRLPGQPRE